MSKKVEVYVDGELVLTGQSVSEEVNEDEVELIVKDSTGHELIVQYKLKDWPVYFWLKD